MRSIITFVLLFCLACSCAVDAEPQNQGNQPIPTPIFPTLIPTTTPQPGNLRVIVTPPNGSPVTVTVPAVTGLGDIDRCREREGFNAWTNAPREVFCRNLRAELAKNSSTERLARGGQINLILTTGDPNQQPNANTTTFIQEGKVITVAVTPPAGGPLVVLTLPAVPGLRNIPSCRTNDGMNPNDSSPEAVYCRNLRLRAAEKVPGMNNIGQGGDIYAQLVINSGVRSMLSRAVGVIGSVAIPAALWMV